MTLRVYARQDGSMIDPSAFGKRPDLPAPYYLRRSNFSYLRSNRQLITYYYLFGY